jgi:integrase
MSAGSLQTDARRLVKTTTPGIFKRGDRYVAVYRDDDGRQCKKSCATLAEARTFKSTVTADKARGEFVVQSRVTVADYFDDWLPAYTGRTSPRAGVAWASFHTLRHSCATMLFRAGKNPKQVQAWLGHHAASFTMDAYVHLLPDDVGEAPHEFDLLSPASDEANGIGPDLEDSLARHVL